MSRPHLQRHHDERLRKAWAEVPPDPNSRETDPDSHSYFPGIEPEITRTEIVLMSVFIVAVVAALCGGVVYAGIWV